MQVTRHLIAPNATFDRISGYRPGEACTTRDLIEDLYQSLNKRGIPLLLYYTGDGPRLDEKANAQFGFNGNVSPEFVQKWTDVAREYSLRYGDKIKGWWVDGCYPWIGYNNENLEQFAEALKAGNPHSIVAFNRGVDPIVMSYTPAEDFTCGEQNRFFDMPSQRWLDGEQWHILSYIGTGWGQAGSQYSKRELREYVFDVNQRGGVVSMDVLLYRDGSLDRSQLEMLKEVRRELNEGKTRAGPAGEPGLPQAGEAAESGRLARASGKRRRLLPPARRGRASGHRCAGRGRVALDLPRGPRGHEADPSREGHVRRRLPNHDGGEAVG